MSRVQDLAILNTIAQALNSALHITDALQTTLAQVAQLLNLETGWVWLLDEAEAEAWLAAAQNLPPGLASNPAAMEGSCYCLRTFREGDMAGAANINVVTCSRLKWLEEGKDGFEFHASIPLYAHGRKMGVLNVASRDWRELDGQELDLLHTIGDMLGIAVERAQLFERSARLGMIEERNRLAREIHDTLAQELAGIALQLESADALLDAAAEPERVRQIVQQALTMTRTGLDEVQRSVLDLRAAPLAGRSLAEGLAELVDSLREEQGLSVELQVIGERPLSPRHEIGLYRIAQEGLRNVVQHAAAGCVGVRLTLTPNQAELIIEDDGRGFDVAAVPVQSWGLVGMNERARLLNGRFHLLSSPGQGTALTVQIPL